MSCLHDPRAAAPRSSRPIHINLGGNYDRGPGMFVPTSPGPGAGRPAPDVGACPHRGSSEALRAQHLSSPLPQLLLQGGVLALRVLDALRSHVRADGHVVTAVHEGVHGLTRREMQLSERAVCLRELRLVVECEDGQGEGFGDGTLSLGLRRHLCRHVAPKLRLDDSRVAREGRDAGGSLAAGELTCKENVRQFGLAVCGAVLVLVRLARRPEVEADARVVGGLLRRGRHGHDAGGGGGAQHVHQELSEVVVGHMVDTNVHLEAVRRLLVAIMHLPPNKDLSRRLHDACVENEHMAG
mmetsp:Transcript_15940/g.46506  ORF Transcript_15940/g.46506 Transcript_15940/m.46506 type:complete len:297 (+) Transcript_15940:66-956(+)